MPCVYLPGPAPAVTVANTLYDGNTMESHPKFCPSRLFSDAVKTLSLNFFFKFFIYCLSLLYRQPEKLRQRWKFRVFIHLLH